MRRITRAERSRFVKEAARASELTRQVLRDGLPNGTPSPILSHVWREADLSCGRAYWDAGYALSDIALLLDVPYFRAFQLFATDW